MEPRSSPNSGTMFEGTARSFRCVDTSRGRSPAPPLPAWVRKRRYASGNRTPCAASKDDTSSSLSGGFRGRHQLLGLEGWGISSSEPRAVPFATIRAMSSSIIDLHDLHVVGL